MNSYLNYLIEANLGLLLFYAIYLLLLKNENQFGFKRAYLLGSLIASLLFPLINLSTPSSQLIPSLSNLTTTHWLPEITIYANGPIAESTATVQTSVWLWIVYAYLTGLVLFFVLFVVRVASLIALFHSAKKHSWRNYTVAESEKGHGSFSFFHFIFLGKASELNEQEKQEVLLHEEVHAQKIHSFDIVLVNILGIVFWFNPIVRFYRNSLVQVHEFEADARSVEGRDVNAYCNLLAKVALQSNGYTLANHFTNSLTLKRITMMKTIRKKIQQWKVATAALAIATVFVVVACQDQVIQDIKDVTSKSTMIDPENYTDQVKQLVSKLQTENPSKSFFVMELTEADAQKKFEELEAEYKGIFKGLVVGEVKGNSGRFTIFEKGERSNRLSEMTMAEGEVFSIVEETASPIGGYPVLYEYIGKNLKYPQQARTQGIEGKVFIEFVVNVDGTLSDFVAIKGIGAGCDQEAMNVLKKSPLWNPGKQNGKAVRQRMVIPINFKLGMKTDQQFSETPQKVEQTNSLSQRMVTESEVLLVVDETASPIGGYPVLYEYIGKNLKYPQQARTQGIEGKVFVEFIVNVNGTLSDFVTVRGIGAGCDLEAIQVMKNAPVWNPGKHQGKTVRQRMVIPIVFKLG